MLLIFRLIWVKFGASLPNSLSSIFRPGTKPTDREQQLIKEYGKRIQQFHNRNKQLEGQVVQMSQSREAGKKLVALWMTPYILFRISRGLEYTMLKSPSCRDQMCHLDKSNLKKMENQQSSSSPLQLVSSHHVSSST